MDGDGCEDDDEDDDDVDGWIDFDDDDAVVLVGMVVRFFADVDAVGALTTLLVLFPFSLFFSFSLLSPFLVFPVFAPPSRCSSSSPFLSP